MVPCTESSINRVIFNTSNLDHFEPIWWRYIPPEHILFETYNTESFRLPLLDYFPSLGYSSGNSASCLQVGQVRSLSTHLLIHWNTK